MSDLLWLQNWYREQCDGQWEHEYGIEINTLDNPGWQVKIDGLKLISVAGPPMRIADEVSETSWMRCSLENGIFLGYGDPEKLERIIQIFRGWIQKA